MVFSFFKKKDADSDRQASALDDASLTGGPVSVVVSALGNDMVMLVESGMSEAMENAAICYANEQDDDAIAVLRTDIESGTSRDSIDAWLMLFDLYFIRNRRREYDELAMRYVVTFERSAPVWPNGEQSMPVDGANQVVPVVTLPAALSPSSLGAQFAQFDDCVLKKCPVRIDASRVNAIDAAGAISLQAHLQKLRQAGCAIELISGEAFSKWLGKQIQIMRRDDEERPIWILLLEVFQHLGKQVEFENTAVDYAVTYEVSPPSWDAKALELARAKAATVQVLPVSEPMIDAYQFGGSINSATEATFAAMLDWGRKNNPVRIDFSKVKRIDFVSCGLFMNALFNLTAAGHEIEIIGANEPVIALFLIIGISEVARIRRRRA